MTKLLHAALMFGLAAFLAAASAHEITSGSITVSHPWARATPPGATTGAAYVKIANKGEKAVTLLGATTPYAERVEIHSMSMDGGVMRMRPIEGGIAIPAGGQVALKPGSNHLMLIGLKKPLVEEDFVPVTLVFDGGIKVDIELYVEAMGAGGGEHGH